MAGQVEEGGGALDRDAAGGAEERLELLGAQGALLGEEVEDAAAAVVDHEDADRDADVPKGGEAADVVEQAQVPGDDRRRPPARCAAPMPEEISPSIPFAPRLQRKSTSASPGATKLS